MAKCIVIADDLTGGNSTGVLMTKMNYTAFTVLNPAAVRPEEIGTSDCVIRPTDSRGLSPEEAAGRVREAVLGLMDDGVKVYSHRIDSTLRGNIGAETDAMLDVLGDDYVAFCVPCFPETGRIVCGGYLLLDGIPLHKTSIAVDPKSPVKNPRVAEVVREQTKYPVCEITMKDMMQGRRYLADVLRRRAAEGNRIICLDCVTQEDVDLIADAVITSGLKTLCVDPGVFTATLSGKLITPSHKSGEGRILAVVGSVHPLAREQMENLWLSSEKTHNVFVKTKEFLESDERRESEIERVTEEILSVSGRYTVSTVTGDGIYPENRIDFTRYIRGRDRMSPGELSDAVNGLTEIINRSLGEIAYRIFSRDPGFRAVYSSGGDVTVALCEVFGTSGLELKDEVLPLAAYGEFRGGPFQGVHIVTKGGSQGASDAVSRCTRYLKEKLHI